VVVASSSAARARYQRAALLQRAVRQPGPLVAQRDQQQLAVQVVVGQRVQLGVDQRRHLGRQLADAAALFPQVEGAAHGVAADRGIAGQPCQVAQRRQAGLVVGDERGVDGEPGRRSGRPRPVE
jgi:hypothetical protein